MHVVIMSDDIVFHFLSPLSEKRVKQCIMLQRSKNNGEYTCRIDDPNSCVNILKQILA